jgi:hypothetical protein
MLAQEERLRVLSRLFTRPTITSLCRTGDWRVACSFLQRHDLLRPSQGQILGSIFELAWDELRKLYRSEYVYKNEVANRIIFGRHRPNTAAFQVEMPVGRSIVDIAVYNGTSSAYEIKTEFDSARRLETQTRDYLKAFEIVYVVTHPDFASKYADVVRPEVGVLALRRNGSLSVFKQAAVNYDALDRQTIFRCLRREEYLGALDVKAPGLRKLPNGLVSAESFLVFNELPKNEAHKLYVDSMRKRKANQATADFARELPRSLRALGCGITLSPRQREKLVSVLQSTIGFTIV